MSEEEEWEPNYCPNCAEDDVDYLGKAEKGYHVLYCRGYGRVYAIKDVTGKVRVRIEGEI